jgi:DNA primase
MDVIALHQAGITTAVAALGTSFTAEQVNLISRYTKEIVIIMDADAAGQKAVRRAFEMLKNSGLNVKVVSVPEGKDPDEFIKKHGADKFKYLLEGAVSDMDYKLLAAAEGINTNEDAGRIEYIGRAISIIADCNDSITREVYIGRICDKYGVSRTTVNARVSELRKSNAKKIEKKIISDAISPKVNAGDINPDRRLSPRAAKAEEGVIAVLLQHPDFFSDAKEQLPPDKMITSLNKRIYEIIYETLDGGGEIEISVFGQRLLPAELGFVVALQNSERAANNPKMVLKDCIAVILEESMLKADNSSDDTSVEDWAKKMQSLIDKKK